MKKLFKSLIAVFLIGCAIVGLNIQDYKKVASQEVSLGQEGLDTSVAIFQREYPIANIEAVNVELDRNNEVYLITIKGYDANATYTLEVEYVDYGVRQQVFSDGLFKMKPRETEAPAYDDERARLRMNQLISLDEATEIALAEVDNLGVAVKWTLFSDTREWWDIFNAAEENENPIWMVELDYDDLESSQEESSTTEEAMTTLEESETSQSLAFWQKESQEESEETTAIIEINEIRIDAKTGQVLYDTIVE